jgi:hypothetical protein
MNELEKSEYDRLFQLNDPEGYASQLKKKKELDELTMTEVPKVSATYTEADMLNSMVMLTKQAGVIEVLQAGTGVDKGVGSALAGAGAWAGKHKGPALGLAAAGTGAIGWAGHKLAGVGSGAGTAWGALKQMYPLTFAILMLSGFAAGKHFSDSGDMQRMKKKQLKKYLAQELMDSQSPTILEVGSELPWEKAKAGGADLALSESELPESAISQKVKERREIRI